MLACSVNVKQPYAVQSYTLFRNVAASLLTIAMMKDFWKLCQAQGEEKCHSVKSAPMWRPHRKLPEPSQVKVLHMWEREYRRIYSHSTVTAGSGSYSSTFFVKPNSILSNPPQSAVSMRSSIDCTLSQCLFYTLADHNKACYPTKQINVRCKKVMMWRWTLNTQSDGLLNQPQCWAIPTECMIKQLQLRGAHRMFGS